MEVGSWVRVVDGERRCHKRLGVERDGWCLPVVYLFGGPTRRLRPIM